MWVVAQRADRYPAIWAEPPPDQHDRLEKLLQDAYKELYADLVPKMIERAVQAAVAFSAEYPDAPRAKEAVPA